MILSALGVSEKTFHFPRYLHQPVSRSQKINQRLSRSQWEVPILEYFHCAKQLQIDGHHFSPCPNVLRRGSGGLNRHEPSISHFILSNPTYLGSLSDRGCGSTTISWNGNIAIDFHGKMILKKGLVPTHTIIKWSWEWAHIQATTNCTGAWQHGITQKTPKESMFSLGNSNMAIEILRL